MTVNGAFWVGILMVQLKGKVFILSLLQIMKLRLHILIIRMMNIKVVI